VRLAAERGEVDGHCGLQVSAIKSILWDEFKAERFSVPIQLGLQKHPELADVANAYDLATNEEDRQLFRLIFGQWAFGRPLMAPPDTPPDRVEGLRQAFEATLVDPQFVAEARKARMEVQPMASSNIAKLVDAILRTPRPVMERARILLGAQNR
jgi:hypothetical protein